MSLPGRRLKITDPTAAAAHATDAALLRLCQLGVAATVRASESVDPPLPAMQLRALTLLAETPGHVLPVGPLADGIGTTMSSTSRICQRLVRSGLVDRPRTPGTERPVHLTERGRAVLAEVNARRLDVLRQSLAELPARVRSELARAIRTARTDAG